MPGAVRTMQTGQLAYDANYELINDNLLDLSHLSYVHQNTLGRNSMSWGESRPRTTRIERGLRVERWVGKHETRSNYELVVVPSPHLLAVSVAGRQPQVIVSTGLIETLLPEELEAVVRHECAHLDQRHQRYLLVARAVDAGFRFLPFVRRSTAAVRIGLERWADEVAAGETAEGRERVREALLMTTAAVVGSELAPFSAAE